MMTLTNKVMLLATLPLAVPAGPVAAGERVAGGGAGALVASAAAAEKSASHSPIAPFRFDHRNYLPGIVVADTASCKKQCEKDRQKCYQRCEDLYGDSPQGGGCQSECDKVKTHVCRPRC